MFWWIKWFWWRKESPERMSVMIMRYSLIVIRQSACFNARMYCSRFTPHLSIWIKFANLPPWSVLHGTSARTLKIHIRFSCGSDWINRALRSSSSISSWSIAFGPRPSRKTLHAVIYFQCEGKLNIKYLASLPRLDLKVSGIREQQVEPRISVIFPAQWALETIRRIPGHLQSKHGKNRAVRLRLTSLEPWISDDSMLLSESRLKPSTLQVHSKGRGFCHITRFVVESRL